MAVGAFENAHQIRCGVPPSPVPQRVPLAISFDSGVTQIPADQPFEFAEALYIRQVIPGSGAVTGGTFVRIHGGTFDQNETIQCRFGGHSATTPATVLSSTELVCVTPVAAAAGAVDLEIQSIDRFVTARLARGFSFTKPAYVTDVFPRSAFEQTETLFDVYGAGFLRSPLLKCDFGERVQSESRQEPVAVHTAALWVSSTHIKCWSPRHRTSMGRVRIGVSNNGEDFIYASISQVIAFVTRFDVGSIFPVYGSVNGGTTVVLEESVSRTRFVSGASLAMP